MPSYKGILPLHHARLLRGLPSLHAGPHLPASSDLLAHDFLYLLEMQAKWASKEA